MAGVTVTVTDTGLEEIINAGHTGTAAVKLTQIGFGTGIYTPTSSMTALQAEFKRVTILSGKAVGDQTISCVASDNSSDTYSVNEFGVYTENGTLFAVYSQEQPLLQKTGVSAVYLAVDMLVSGVSLSQITFESPNFSIVPATTEIAGVAKIATVVQVKAGQDGTTIVTPSTLYQALSDSESELIKALIDALKKAKSGLQVNVLDDKPGTSDTLPIDSLNLYPEII